MTLNLKIAELLDEAAELLELQDGNPFRVRSYRNAAEAIRKMKKPVSDILSEKGKDGLQDIPGIGNRLAASIREIVKTGHLKLLDRLESKLSPERIISKVPGIGEKLAARIHSQLDIDSLPELEMAAHNGRLKEVEGLGASKISGIRDALAGMLSRRGRSKAREKSTEADQPDVALLLEIDKLYREKAAKNELRKIAPKRFNPERKKWLPVMNTQKQGWTFTVLYSNSARAHDLNKTHDWVVIYYDDGEDEGQNTVITAGSGPLEGSRIVPGREKECYNHYQKFQDTGI